jgi:hypothetical protein
LSTIHILTEFGNLPALLYSWTRRTHAIHMFKEQFRRGQLQNIRKVRCRANVPGINGVNHLYIVSHHCQLILLSSFTDHFSFLPSSLVSSQVSVQLLFRRTLAMTSPSAFLRQTFLMFPIRLTVEWPAVLNSRIPLAQSTKSPTLRKR